MPQPTTAARVATLVAVAALFAAQAAITAPSLSWSRLDLAAGVAEGTMCRREGMFSGPDTDDCISVSGRFETERHEAEG